MNKLITSLHAVVFSSIILSYPTQAQVDPNASDLSSTTGTADAFLMRIAQKWTFVQTLKYDVDTKDTESEGV